MYLPYLKILDVLERYLIEPFQFVEQVFAQLKERVCSVKPAVSS